MAEFRGDDKLKKVMLENGKEVKMKNGMKAIKGECPKCGTKDQYGDNCEVCNMSIVELHHIISKSKNENHWSILCPLCHEIISRKIILIKNREDLFTKLKPFVKKLYSNLRL